MPVFQLTDRLLFPPPQLADEDGLLAVGGDLSEQRLLLAYSMGIFPWFMPGEPIFWWSPDPRLVLFPDEFHMSKRLRRVIRQRVFRVTVNAAFDEVIQWCADIRGSGRESTWLTAEMVKAYRRLHRSGYAHSIECWIDDTLVGGVYGMALGRCFFGESMFSRVDNASKVALASLVDRARTWGLRVIDCQNPTAHLLHLGARAIPRDEFLALLYEGLSNPPRSDAWTPEQPLPWSQARNRPLIPNIDHGKQAAETETRFPHFAKDARGPRVLLPRGSVHNRQTIPGPDPPSDRLRWN